MEIINVIPENSKENTLFCIRDLNSPGFHAKSKWFEDRIKEGIRLKILQDEDRKIAYIEYIPSEYAWRPVKARNYMFIQCMFTYAKKDRNKGYATMLIRECEDDARASGMHGVAVMTSQGAWITNKSLFKKLGYTQVEKLGRFELMVKKFDEAAPDPGLFDWTSRQKEYTGWHLLYSDQCPWHVKAVEAIQRVAAEHGIDLDIRKIPTALDAQSGPSGFGTFALLHNGKLLEDHYISETRFRNILRGMERGSRLL